MVRLSGKEVSQVLRQKITEKSQAFSTQHGRKPGLAVVLVGDDPASQVYVGGKIKSCQAVGIESKEVRLPDDVEKNALLEVINDLSQDAQVDGILVQLPLPKHLDADEILNTIPFEKDVDGLTLASIGCLWGGEPLAIPCTPHGVMKILEHYSIPVAGKDAVVIGRSDIVGKPMAQLLLAANATVTICHSKTTDLKKHTLNADIVVVAAGRPKMIGKEHIKKDATVVDVGIHRIGTTDSGKAKLCGDVKFDELDGHAGAATPVPGGVGPMTITMLLENTLRLAEYRVTK